MGITWNYRVCREQAVYLSEDDESLEYEYTIREVYYDEEGDIWAYSEKTESPFGNNENEFIKDFERYREALNKPVIDLDKKEEVECLSQNE